MKVFTEPCFDAKNAVEQGTYIEFLGGLGDVLNRIYQGDTYARLRTLPSSEHVTVGLLSHNPHAKELFLWHPAADRITLLDYGFSVNWDNPDWRAAHGLPRDVVGIHPAPQDRNEFFPSPLDTQPIGLTRSIGKYIVFVPGGGTVDRNVPDSVLESAADAAISDFGFSVVVVGRNYVHRFREPNFARPNPHPRLRPRPGVIDLIDQTSVPGTAKILEGASGVLTGHTAMCLLAWYVGKKVFLCYNDFVRDHYVPRGLVGYLFGASLPGNDHLHFSAYSRDRVSKFLAGLP